MAMKRLKQMGRPYLPAVALALLLAVISSCGEGECPEPQMSAMEHNEAGWTSYADGEYAGARYSFEAALGIDSGFSEARLGLAWCEAHAAEYVAALDDFEEVVDSRSFVADGFAGRAAAALAYSRDSLAIASAESTLALSPSYEFSRRPAYSWRDLRLIVAQASFALGLYQDAQAQVDLLDPDNGLDPADSGTWIVDNRPHPTYEAALAMEIELLCTLEGGALAPSGQQSLRGLTLGEGSSNEDTELPKR